MFVLYLKQKVMKAIKTISKLTMLFAFVAFANTLMATGNLKVNILPVTSETAVVAISNAKASNFQISIENNKGEVVYYKETDSESNDYRKIFDFSNLENGDYKLSVTVDVMTTERSFSIKNQNIAVGKEKNMIEPYFAYKDGILKLSYLNFSEENLKLNLYNENELVYAKAIGDEFSITEGYDLSKLEKGVYAVVLSTNDKCYTYHVDVE
jgi:hypothetical protein